MKNNFKVGTNFDIELLKVIIELNKGSDKNKVTELYGSDRAHAMLAARPAFRLPDVKFSQLQEYVKTAADVGIGFNYTMNSIIPYGSKQAFARNQVSTAEFVSFLEHIGVSRITVANPMMLELIRNKLHSDIELEASTIMHIDTVTQIRYMFEKYGVRKICCNLNKNRDFRFLEAASRYCHDNGIILELMANEFCGVGGPDYSTHCVYRDSCYICHATNSTLEDTMMFDEYPMKLCTKSRDENPANWLRLKFIRPEDIKVYNDIGINHFKITGRTGSSQYILRTLKSYLDESYDGNLLGLWKPLESIKDGSVESIHHYDIPNKSLDGFIKKWSEGHHLCDNEVCGKTCRYCEEFYRSHCV